MIYAVASMPLSQSSEVPLDPLSDVLAALGATVVRRTRLEAAGRWALSFPAIDRLKFVALLRGSHWIVRPGCAPHFLNEGDVCLIGRTAYTVASHPDEVPVDGQVFYAGGNDVARLNGEAVIGIGGTVDFTTGITDFLLDMLPDFMIVPRSTPTSGAVVTILGLMERYSDRTAIGSEIVSARLADLLLVEAIRAYADCPSSTDVGWLGALGDPRIGRALRAIHGDVAHPWTVAQLAGVAGMSRAAFSAEFSRRVGQPPLTYLRTWRLALARTALARGGTGVAGIAKRVGYSSQSAFGHAFRRAFGISPKANSRAGE